MMDAGLLLHVLAVLGASVVLICRAGAMTPQTDPAIRWRHVLMLAGLVFGLALTLAGHQTLGSAATALGALSWLLLSASHLPDRRC